MIRIFRKATGGPGAETDPVFTASEAALFIAGDKEALDYLSAMLNPVAAQTGADPALGKLELVIDGVTKSLLFYFPGDNEPIVLGDRNV